MAHGMAFHRIKVMRCMAQRFGGTGLFEGGVLEVTIGLDGAGMALGLGVGQADNRHCTPDGAWSTRGL